MRTYIAAVIVMAAGACTESPPATQPEEFDVVDATRVDPGVAPGALGNESVNHSEESITPAERNSIYSVETQSPGQLMAGLANLLQERDFDQAYQLWDPRAASFSADQFARYFEGFETIRAEIGQIAGQSGGGSSSQMQLTLTGTRQNGSNYTVTGPVTLTRVGSGSGSEQQQWRIAKMVLTSNPRVADALVQQ